MNPSTKSHSRLTLLLALLFGLTLVFSMQAQEATEEPAAPAAEVTPEAVEEVPAESVTEAEPEVTTTVTEPAESVVPVAAAEEVTHFSDNFDADLADAWLLSGWEVVSDESGSYLATSAPNSLATVSTFSHASFTLTARLKVSEGNVALLLLNGYSVMFDAFGNSRLYAGDSMLAASAVDEGERGEADWYSVQVDMLANVVNVWVNGTLRLNYVAELPFVAGVVSFASGASNSDTIALDNLTLVKQEALFVAPQPTAMPVSTSSSEDTSIVADAETTPEAADNSEAIDEVADTTASETIASVETPVRTLANDFTSALDGWTTNGAIVDNGDNNRALLLVGGSSASTTSSLVNFELTLTFRLVGEDAALVLNYGASTLTVTAKSATVAHGESNFSGTLALDDAWHTLVLRVRDSVLTLTVDGQPTLAGAIGSEASTVTLQSVGTLFVDNLALADFAPVPTVVAAPAPSARMNSTLEALLSMDAAEYAQFADTFNLKLDDFGRVLVDIGLRAEGESADLVAFIESNGGTVDRVESGMVRAYVIPLSLPLLAEHAQVFGIRPAVFATSTSTLDAPAGTEATEAFGLLGAHAWHQNGVMGAGVKVGIIDVGFGDGTSATLPAKSGEYSCLNSPVALRSGTNTASKHGRNMVELLCDIAPSSSVWLYQADTYETLYNAVEQARVDNIDVLLITLDLGADAAPGDGLGRPTGNNPYTSLQNARNEGMVIIAAAGNSGNPADIGNVDKAARYYAYTTTSSSTATTLTVRVSRGDRIAVSWSGWSDTSDITLNLSGGSITPQTGSRIGVNQAGASVTVPNQGSCASNPTCDLTLTITPSSLSGSTVVQVQLIPVKHSSESTQTADVRIMSVALGTSSSVVNGGSIARPADSPAVLAIGAVCTVPKANFALLPDSSVGPVYGSGGTAPASGPATRTTAKPDLVSFSVVRSYGFDDCDGTIDGLNSAGGFQGTSTAAAHVAGMAALLKSNSSNTSMSGWSTRNATTAQAVEDYLQTRVAELPITSPDGYDYIYGAGIAFLADSRFNLANSATPASAPDSLSCTGGTVYVGQGNANTTHAGTLANPFLTIPHALVGRAANDCVVVLPGEYMTPIYIGTSTSNRIVAYDTVHSTDAPDSLIYVSGQYYNTNDYEVAGFASGYGKVFGNRAGLYVNNSSGNTIEGFKFINIKFNSYVGINAPNTVVIHNSNNTTFLNNEFGQLTANGLSHTGWNGQNPTIFAVLGSGASGAIVVDGNTFHNNTLDGTESFVLAIAGSGTSTNPVVVRNNMFSSNTNGGSATDDWTSIVINEQSYTSILNNVFSGNRAGTIIMSRTKAEADPEFLRVFGNVFLSNEGYANIATVSTGGMINVFYNRYIYFVNNTVVNNNFNKSGTNNALITRGHPDLAIEGEPTSAANETVDIHNNLLKGNTFSNVMTYTSSGTQQCNPNSTSTHAVTHNWWESGLTAISNTSYVCNGVLHNGTSGINNNLTGPIGNENFIGCANPPSCTTSVFPTTDWRYYGLRSSSLAVDRAAAVDKVGIPNSAGAFLPPYNVDILQRGRVRDEPSVTDLVSPLDLGAFEFTAIAVSDNNIDSNGNDTVLSVTVNEDLSPATTTPSPTWINVVSGTLEIDLAELIQDAYGSVSYSITGTPKNFGTQCGTGFSNGFKFGTGSNASKLYYCPPLHFHNDSISTHDPNSPDDASVVITYTAQDDSQNSTQGKIVVRIMPQNDTALSTSIGDGTPAEDIIEITVPTDTTGVTAQARPYVTFNNFDFSEADNPIGTHSSQADYPFTYSAISQVAHFPGDVTGLLTGLTINPSTGAISFNTGAQRGRTTIQYTVTDANSNSVTNYIRVKVTNFIPSEPGLYDDSSFAWSYTNGDPNSPTFGWRAGVNNRAINNTLHTSNGLNDTAEFSFVGTGFVLYMWSEPSGNIFDVRINGNSIMGTWTLVSGTSSTSPVHSRTFTSGPLNGWSCFARTNIGAAPNTDKLTNQGANGNYTVTCNNPSAAPAKHTVQVQNLRQGSLLSVDAFSIINDQTAANGGPLPPGMHNVENPEVRAIFASKTNWIEERMSFYTGGVAYVATGGTTADNISFTIAGGTGFAIGTVLDPRGALFKMCVRNTSTSDDMCQWVDTSPRGITTVRALRSYVPFYGLDPSATYEVTISNIDIPSITATTFGKLVIDTIVVLPPSMTIDEVTGFGTTENDTFTRILYGAMEQGSWLHDFNHATASQRSLTQTTTLSSAAGPFIAFKIPATANALQFNYLFSSVQSTRWMFCVNRALLTATADYGNCVVVNTRPTATDAHFFTINLSNGDFVAGTGTLQISNGTLLLKEANFPAAWGAGFNPDGIPNNGDEYHLFEAFSLLNEQINVDKVDVYSTNAPITAGVHEEFMPVFTYFNSSNSLVTPGAYHATTNNFVNTTDAFLWVTGSPLALRDSTLSAVWTRQVDASISFTFTGTGFAPRFRTNNTSDEVEVCWRRTSDFAYTAPVDSAAEVLAIRAGTCQIFENESATQLHQAEQQIVGLANDTYAVNIRMLPDNQNTSRPATTVISMWFDGVRIYDTDWFDNNVITPVNVNTTVEANFPQRNTDKRLHFFGTDWTFLVNQVNYSANNYNLNNQGYGKGVVLRTTNANAVQIDRPLAAGLSILTLCAAPESNPMQRLCTTINSAGAANRVKTVIPLNTTDATTPHIVTLFGTTPGRILLDALTPVDTTVPLGVGRHPFSHPNIKYPSGGVNLVQNGSMALDNGSTVYWQDFGTPVLNRRVTAPSYLTYTPTFNNTSRSVVIDADGEGIESLPINFENGKTYLIFARVFNNGNGGTISMDLHPSVAGFVAPSPIAYSEPRNWQSFRVVFTANTTTAARLRFTSDVTAITPRLREFLVDDVHVYELGKSNWVVVSNPAVFDRLYTYSTTMGAEFSFSFIGTGFSLGMLPDLYGGLVEVCYDTTPTLASAQCMTFNNNFGRLLTDTVRPFLGLANTPTQFWVRVRDVDNGMQPSLATGSTQDIPRTNLYAPARLVLNFIEVYDNTLPPTITNSVTANENYQISGQSAIRYLPANNWRNMALTGVTRFSENSYNVVVDPRNNLASSTQTGPAMLMRFDLTTPSTLVLYTDAASLAKSDQLVYCVDGHDGRVGFNYVTRLFQLYSATKCKMTNQLRTSSQIVLDLPAATADSVVTVYTLTPGPLLIDGFQFLKGVTLAPGYYETNLSFGAIGGGDGDQIFEVDNPSYWRTQNMATYSGGSALVLEDDTPDVVTLTNPRVNEKLQFKIKGATGFSIVTAHGPFGGQYTINVKDTATDGANYNQTFTQNNFNAALLVGMSLPITGLPLDDYTVTIQNGSSTTTAAKRIVVDAIEVYGALKNLGSLYDDNERNSSGEKLITYGPSQNTWRLNEGPTAPISMNRTNHTTSSAGAVAMFEVGHTTNDATGITIYHNTSTSTHVDVCWKDLSNSNAPICLLAPLNLTATNAAGSVRVNFTSDGSVGAGIAGNYAVSIINRQAARTVVLDAIQVHKGNELTEGIYSAAALNSLGAFQGSVWTPQTTGVWFGTTTNAELTFTLKGIGFSIVLDEDAGSSQQYTLCVDRVTDSVNCDTVGTSGNPLVINRIASPSGRYALTFVGLHSSSGGDETYTVTLKNNVTTTNALKVRSVQVLGAKPASNRLSDSNNSAENNDMRVRYLPFGWATETINRTAPVSGGSQHLGAHRGAVAYVEFKGTRDAFEYTRQLSTAFADADICYGEIGNTTNVTADNTTNCTTIVNSVGAAFGASHTIGLSSVCDSTHGCWVVIRSRNDTRQMPLDLLRFVSTTEPLKAGRYEENYSGLRNFNSSGTIYPASESGTNMNIVPAQSSTLYSGGFARRYIASGTNSALNGGMFFSIEGSGFTVGFTRERNADTVNICYLNYTGPEPTPNTVLTTGTCRVFNNESAATLYRTNRTIVGLPFGKYAVAVQMLPDDNLPVPHLATALPIRMEIDYVQVHGDVWFGANETNWADTTHTNAITPAQGRVETSFTRRATEKNFLYYGSNWRFNEGPSFAVHSGSNFDTISEIGAAIAFRTSGANAAQIFVQLTSANAPIRICATPLNLNPLTISGTTTCRTYDLVGRVNQYPLTFNFGGPVDEYIVTVYTENERAFNLDAVRVFNTTAPLTEGLYEETDPRLFYTPFENAVPNGDMEINGMWTNVGTPTTNSAGTLFTDGIRSRYVVASSGSGIESQPFSLNPTATTTYLVTAKVYVTRGGVEMQVQNLTGFTPVSVTTPLNQWVTIRQEVTLTAGSYPNIKVRFIGQGTNATFYVDSVQISTGGTWRTNFLATQSGGTSISSTTTGAELTFSFQGTGFELSMPTSIQGGEVEICYGVSTPNNCFTYQQESSATTVTSRVVAGLPFNTYQVRVRDVEDGLTTLVRNRTDLPRQARMAVGQITLDYVRIFNEAAPPALPAGFYNEDAKNSSNVPYLQLLPGDRWLQFTGTRATGYTNSSMYGVIRTVGTTQVQETQFTGATAVFSVPVVNGEGASIILYSRASAVNSLMVLVCASDEANVVVDGKITWDGTNYGLTGSTHCVLKTNFRVDNQIVIDRSELAALSPSASTGTKRVTFTTLSPGLFNIDGYQVVKGKTLSVGIHDDFLPDSLLDFGAPPTQTEINRAAVGCNPTQGWCIQNNVSAIGGKQAMTATDGAALTFQIEGTGFSVITTLFNVGIDFRICYKKASNTTPFPALSFDINAPSYRNNINLDGTGPNSIWCEMRSNNSALFGPSKWTDFNSDYLAPSALNRFGFSFYGLPFDKYDVSIVVKDATILATQNRLFIDAIAVFGNTNGVLQPGFYDNTVAQISYEPAALWTHQSFTAAPPRGPFNMTESSVNLAGAIAQFRVNGNSFTLFQSTGFFSRSVRICKALTGATIHCTPEVRTTTSNAIKQAFQIGEFSQSGAASNFTPVMFYGLGEGTHHIILENRDHNRKFGIDAIMVQP